MNAEPLLEYFRARDLLVAAAAAIAAINTVAVDDGWLRAHLSTEKAYVSLADRGQVVLPGVSSACLQSPVLFQLRGVTGISAPWYQISTVL